MGLLEIGLSEKELSESLFFRDPEELYDAEMILPGNRSWLGRRVIAFLHSEYISKHAEERRKVDE